MITAPKFLHIARPMRRVPVGHAGYTRVSLCGRLVNRMALTDEAGATCQKCVAESLARTAAKVTA